MVERLRKRFVEGGLERALHEDPRPGAAPKLDGKQQAGVIAKACSISPAAGARHNAGNMATIDRWPRHRARYCAQPSAHADTALITILYPSQRPLRFIAGPDDIATAEQKVADLQAQIDA
jgi:hypothetical protein